VVSLLNEPNTYSPANVDASVMFRRWKDSKGKDKEYENIIRKQVQASRLDAEKDNVVVPTTMEEYCMKAKPLRPAQDSIEMDDFYDDDCYDMDDDDEDEDEDEDEEKEPKYDDAEDSGNGESWERVINLGHYFFQTRAATQKITTSIDIIDSLQLHNEAAGGNYTTIRTIFSLYY